MLEQILAAVKMDLPQIINLLGGNPVTVPVQPFVQEILGKQLTATLTTNGVIVELK